MISQETVTKIHEILDRGLCAGVGDPDGQMCIEAAVCYAMGEPHGDTPSCVEPAVRSFKIKLNDSEWSSPQARAEGLRSLAIAQLGSKGVVDGREFAKRLAEGTIRRLVPALFREVFTDAKCLAAADRCEADGSARAAADAARVAGAEKAAGAAAWAADAAAAAAWATDATDAVRAARAARVTGAAARATAWAAQAADAARAARAAKAADAAAWATEAVWVTDAAAGAAGGDKYLLLSAEIALDVLRELKSPGVAFLEE